MAAFLIRRTLRSLLVIIGVAVAVFFIARLSGDPVLLMITPGSTVEEIEGLRQALGLDRPLTTQLWEFLFGLLRGDLGDSLWQRRPVTELIRQRLPYTLQLTGAAMFLSLALALPLGVISAVKRNTLADRLAMLLALIGQSMPTFWLGLLLIQVFAVGLHWFPSSGAGGLKNLVLPAVTLGMFSAARTTRLVRSGLLDVLGEDYIRTARAKGLRNYVVVTRHALRNAMLPVVTLVAIEVGRLLGGAVITETIFAWPGLGRLAIDAIEHRDLPLLQGIVLVIATVFVLINLLVDVLYSVLDPRIRSH
jgi:peptide/nickel transport system permease protein